MANHKRKRPKQQRARCMLCKPSKNSHTRTADRLKAEREWHQRESDAY
jgi:hypothetical protein